MNTYIKIGAMAIAVGYSTVMGVCTAKAVKDFFNRKSGKVNIAVDNSDIDEREIEDAE